ncbi:MAG: hypothetical protein JEZ07_19050 [Phycisphaerae bacterium]|nr:hypothetical protein [Phycisphaerae bacterium]
MKDRFMDLWQRVGGNSNGNSEYDRILAAYQENDRHYHNLAHIEKCLTELDEVSVDEWVDEIEFAIWYHDMIYDTTDTDNEYQSALLAKEVCHNGGISSGFANIVAQLIMATSHRTVAKSQAEKIIRDIDLVILASRQQQYDDYAENIRREYEIYSDQEYRQGRMNVLRYFLAQERIYLTDDFYGKYETIARANIEREIEQLILRS